MSNDWLRLWHDLPNDPKWRSIARASGKSIPAVISVYIHMLVCASNADERGRTQGWCDEDVANALDLTTDDVNAIREAMQGRVLEGDHLKGWEKRQPKRDDGAAERAKAWREKKKEEEEQERTQPNADKRPEKIQKEDTDTDLSSEGKPSSDKPLPFALPDWIDPADWDGFMEVRKQRKAPNTRRAMQGLISALGDFRAKGHSVHQIIETSIQNGWKGVFEPKKGTGYDGQSGKTKHQRLAEAAERARIERERREQSQVG
jgi:hypothetical protein